MKLKGELSQQGIQWLDRVLPLFEKLSAQQQQQQQRSSNLTTTKKQNLSLTIYFDSNQMSLVCRREDTNGVDLHCDMQTCELFQLKSYVCQSQYRNQIAFKVSVHSFLRVVKSLVSVKAQGAQVKLLRREHKRDRTKMTPMFSFASFGGDLDIVQDVNIYGPLNRKEIEDISDQIDTRRFKEVPYWLDLDFQAAQALREALEHLKHVSARVEVCCGRDGTVHIAGEKTVVASAGVELRGVPIAPSERDSFVAIREEARTAQMRLAEMRADRSNRTQTTRGILSAKQLGKGFMGTMTRPDVCFFGFADGARRLEMVHRFYSARRVIVDAESGKQEESQDSVIVRFRIPVEEEEDEVEEDDEDMLLGSLVHNKNVGGGARVAGGSSINTAEAARTLLGVKKLENNQSKTAKATKAMISSQETRDSFLLDD
jgi:hypothetical protein